MSTPTTHSKKLVARPWTKWKAEWNALLGTCSDRELAGRLGVCTSLVTRHRQEAGVTPFRRWSSEARANSSRCQEAEARRKIVRRAVRRHGAVVDKALVEDLALHLGVSKTRVLQLIAEVQVQAEGKERRP